MRNPLSHIPNDELFQWNGSHSDFVTMTMLMTGRAPRGYDDPETQERIEMMGEILLNIIKIDISPYPDFKSMYAAVPPSPDLLFRMLETLERQINFDSLIQETGVEPSPETQADDIFSTLMGWEMVRRLSPYVDFVPGQLPEGFFDDENGEL